MNLRQLIKKPYISPSELAMIAGISVSTARKKIEIVRKELEEQGYINMSKSKVPTKVLIERLNIDVDWLEKVGGLDEILM
jgi:ribosomal protein S25